MNTEDFKVTGLAITATALPAGNTFLQGAESGLKIVLLIAQVGIAIFTLFYVYKRWKNTKVRKPRAAKNPPTNP